MTYLFRQYLPCYPTLVPSERGTVEPLGLSTSLRAVRLGNYLSEIWPFRATRGVVKGKLTRQRGTPGSKNKNNQPNTSMNLAVIPASQEGLPNALTRLIKALARAYNGVPEQAFLYVRPKIRVRQPSLLLIDPKFGVALFETSSWSKDSISSIEARTVVRKNGPTETNPFFELRLDAKAADACLSGHAELVDDLGESLLPVRTNIYWSRILDESNFPKGANSFQGETRLHFDLSNLTIEHIFGDEHGAVPNDTAPLSPEQIQTARSALIPECALAVPSSSLDRIHSPENARRIKLLDIKQEEFAKKLLTGHVQVSGVPGSGKTVLVTARAIHLARMHPEWKILVMTFNKSLRSRLERSIKSMESQLAFHGSSTTNIHVRHFHAVCLAMTGAAIPSHSKDEFFTKTLPQLALQKAPQNQYDAVLVDEYQDFHEPWLRLVVALARKHDDGKQSIFLAGDKLQSIYAPNEFTWKSVGLNVVGAGHSICLKHTYRVGAEHIRLALEFLRECGGLRSEVDKFYEGDSGFSAESNIQNSIRALRGGENVVADQIASILRSGGEASDIMVLVPAWRDADRIIACLSADIRSKTVVAPTVEGGDLIHFVTYHSAKGLERPHVIVTFAEKRSEPKLLYVALTRASNSLYLHVSNGHGSKYTDWLLDRIKT